MALDADLADADAVVKLAEDALSIKGHIDILLNNGGTIFRAPATDFPFSTKHCMQRYRCFIRSTKPAS